jgi:hypothetical protein
MRTSLHLQQQQQQLLLLLLPPPLLRGPAVGPRIQATAYCSAGIISSSCIILIIIIIIIILIRCSRCPR